MTRAKQHLLLTAHTVNDQNKERIMAEFLQTDAFSPILSDTAPAPSAEQLVPSWELRHIHLPKVSQAELLAPTLQNYQLSATHLNNFIDVTRGGPQAFLLQNLLRFPQAATPSQAFGQAIHAVLARAHTHISATKERRPIEDILQDYELQLQNCRLGERDFTYLLEKGGDILHNYLAKCYDSFRPDQKAERTFGTQNVRVGDVRLTGVIDLIDVDIVNRSLVITDYKTGKPLGDWRGKTDAEKIKLHKYRQQLMLYKLLAENSRDFEGYTVTKGALEFVEPNPAGDCLRLELTFNDDELAIFKQLLTAVWGHIVNLDFPDTTQYGTTYKGIVQFEQDLLKK